MANPLTSKLPDRSLPIIFMYFPTEDDCIEKNTIAYYRNIYCNIVSGSINEGAKSGDQSPRHGGRLGADPAHGLVSVE
jgi:hypothetical protein